MECICLVCGKKFFKPPSHIKKGEGKYCSRNCHNLSQVTHGKTKTRMYGIWSSMKQRCYNPNATSFSDYGGRGIKVCDRWQSFEPFYVDIGERPQGHTLDRIDNTKDYSPENCRWATFIEQNNNTRGNNNITFNGTIMTLKQWTEKFGLKYKVVSLRINQLKWSIEKALTTPTHSK